jgi:hypothetical protein
MHNAWAGSGKRPISGKCMNKEMIDAIIDRIYEAGLDVSKWQSVVNQLHSIFPYSAIALYGIDLKAKYSSPIQLIAPDRILHPHRGVYETCSLAFNFCLDSVRLGLRAGTGNVTDCWKWYRDNKKRQWTLWSTRHDGSKVPKNDYYRNEAKNLVEGDIVSERFDKLQAR